MSGAVITRLRPYPTEGELAAMYPAPHDARLYGRGHGIRVAWTIATARAWQPNGYVNTVDLSCGNAEIPRALAAVSEPMLGDLAPGYPFHGPLEDTIPRWAEFAWGTRAGLFVLSETLEHVDDPAGVLAAIRPHATSLLLTTPMMPGGDTNPEHLWCWNRLGVEDLLAGAGWTVDLFSSLDTRPFGDPYYYGLWIAS